MLYMLRGANTDKEDELSMPGIRALLGTIRRGWGWLAPRLAAVEFVGATVMLGMVVGNNLRVVAELKGWV